MQIKWILFFIVAMLVVHMSASEPQDFQKQDVIKANPRCPEGYRKVGEWCHRIRSS